MAPTSSSSQRNNGERVMVPWSHEEDELLKRLVNENGARNWSSISNLIPGRPGKSCRLRWCNKLVREELKGDMEEDASKVVAAEIASGCVGATITDREAQANADMYYRQGTNNVE